MSVRAMGYKTLLLPNNYASIVSIHCWYLFLNLSISVPELPSCKARMYNRTVVMPPVPAGCYVSTFMFVGH